MRNRYVGPCKDCGENVEVGAGYFERQRGGGWKTRHVLCVANAKIAQVARLSDLTHAQQFLVRQQREDRPDA